MASGVTFDTGAVSGKAGKLLFDPDQLIIGGVAQANPGNTPTVGSSALPSIYTQGGDVELDANTSIVINGVIDTRKYGGAHIVGLLSDANVISTGSSGSITLSAPSITINSTGALYADANGYSLFHGGAVTLSATVTDSQAQLPSSATTGITINGAITGASVSATATSTASTQFLNSALGMAQFGSGATFGIITGIAGGYVKSEAEAKVTVGSSGSIKSGGTVTLSSIGSETATDPAIAASLSAVQNYVAAGVVVGVVNANVATEVQSGAYISAGDLRILSTNDANLAVAAITFTTSAATGATFAYSTGTLNTRAYVDPGASLVQAGNVTVAAKATNSFATSASSLAGGAGQGSVAVAISDITSKAVANLGANVAASGDVTVYAGSNNANNSVKASSTVGSPALISGITGAISGTSLEALFSPGKFFDSSGAGAVANANDTASTSRVGLTLALNESSLSSSASIAKLTPDSNGVLQAGSGLQTVTATGNVAVISVLKDAGIRGDAEASINSGDGALANPTTNGALAMAVNVTQITHNSNAFIGSGVTVSGNNVGVAASIEIPITNSWTNFAGFTEVTRHLNGNLGVAGSILTSYAEADSKATQTGLSGAVNYLQITNNTTAWIGSGAHVSSTNSNACASSCWSTALSAVGIGAFTWDNNVVVRATTTTQTVNIGGNFSWLTFFGTNGTAPDSNAVGGAANANIFASNTVAGIGAGAMVNLTAGGLTVDAETRDLVYAVAPTSGKGAGLALNGIASVLQFNNTTWAGISKDAQVTATTVNVNAQQTISAFDVAGAVGSSSESGVGISVALASVSTDTKAFIGDVSGALTKTGATGDDIGVAATSSGFVDSLHLYVDATTAGRFTTVSISAQSANNTPDVTAPPAVQATQPSTATYLEKAAFFFVGIQAGFVAKIDAAYNALTQKNTQVVNGGDSTAGAGSASIALTSLNTTASIADARIRYGAGGVNTVAVQAVNNTIIDTAAGGAALSKGAPGTDKAGAYAGAVAVTLSDGMTTASIASSNLAASEVSVKALAGGETTTIGIALAASVTASSSSGGTAASASVSVAQLHDGVNASVDSSTVANVYGAGNLSIIAAQETNIGIGGGSLYIRAGGSGSGFGVALTYAEIGDPSGGAAVSATLSNSSVQSYNALNVQALGLKPHPVGCGGRGRRSRMRADSLARSSSTTSTRPSSRASRKRRL